jgi:hypothetical protein
MGGVNKETKQLLVVTATPIEVTRGQVVKVSGLIKDSQLRLRLSAKKN